MHPKLKAFLNKNYFFTNKSISKHLNNSEFVVIDNFHVLLKKRPRKYSCQHCDKTPEVRPVVNWKIIKNEWRGTCACRRKFKP